MRIGTYLRKEALQSVRDPFGLVLAFVVPFLIVWTYSLLDLGVVAFPDSYRETSPVALVLCLSVWLSGLTMASTAVYRERLSGTLERLTVTPFSPGLMIAAKSLVLLGLSLVQALVVWFTGRLLVADELAAARGLTGLYGLIALGFASVALGLFLSSFLNSSTQISNAVTFATLAVISFSGFFRPLADLGRVGVVGSYFPFTIGYRILRSVVMDQTFAWDDVVVLALEGLLLLLLGLGFVRGLSRPRAAH